MPMALRQMAVIGMLKTEKYHTNATVKAAWEIVQVFSLQNFDLWTSVSTSRVKHLTLGRVYYLD